MLLPDLLLHRRGIVEEKARSLSPMQLLPFRVDGQVGVGKKQNHPTYMKRTIQIKTALLGACFLASLFCAGVASAQTVDIAPMTWTEGRSDWINIKTDPALPVRAVGDGVTDDTAAIQAALNLTGTVGYVGRKTIYIPAGTYKITSTLTWNSYSGGAIIGCGRNTILKWYGASGAAMYWSQGNTRTRYVGLTWDGNNLAGCGVLHKTNNAYESRSRHENCAFKNFVVNGTYIEGRTLSPAGVISGLNGSACPTAETMIWNCLFYNCTNGVIVGYEIYNFYMWIFDGCEFQNCGVGVAGGCGKYTITNSHFEGSTVADTNGGVTGRVRHCTSVGSAGFFLEGGPSGAASTGAIQDCWIDGWTGNQGAIRFGLRGPNQVFDCAFTHPPTGATAPIYLINSNVNILASNNYAPGFANLTYGNAPKELVTVPCGSLTSSMTSPRQRFLQSDPIVDSANIMDISKPPYNVVVGGTADVTAVIQQAINDAKTASNGSIVYLPYNGYGYKISSTLNVSGSNYKIQGSGIMTKIFSTLSSGTMVSGTMVSVTDPQNIAMEQMILVGTDKIINQTGTMASSMTYDGIYGIATGYQGALNLDNLPAGSAVYIPHLDCTLNANDCGLAQIYAKYVLSWQINVSGATKAKTGFLGVAVAQNGQQTSPSWYNINVLDNQDLILGDYYDEQTYNDLNLQRGNGTGTGRVTIHGFKMQSNVTSTQINVNNYAGRLTYGLQPFTNGTTATVINHVGTNALDMILTGNVYNNGTPSISLGSGCTLIEVGDLSVLSGTVTYRANTPSPLTAANLSSIASAMDHQRQLGALGLWMDYGILQVVKDPTFETGTANPNPTTALGYVPTGWVVTGTYASGTGVRNLTVSGTGSPFSTGTQSMLWVDTTGTNVGTGLVASLLTAVAPANEGGIWTFDYCAMPSGTYTDVRLRLYAGYYVCANLHLFGGALYANAGGRDTLVSTTTPGTWYRVQVKVGAPSAGTSNATIYITPWTTSGPGTTASLVIDGVPNVLTSGFSGMTMVNGTTPGNPQGVYFDNISVVANGTL